MKTAVSAEITVEQETGNLSPTTLKFENDLNAFVYDNVLIMRSRFIYLQIAVAVAVAVLTVIIMGQLLLSRYSHFYRATLCSVRYMPRTCVCVSVCVCLSQAGVVLKRLNGLS